jgi:type IV pilus assembly protein PilB
MTQSSLPRRGLVARNDFSPFGNKLVQLGFLNSQQMQQALVESRKSNRLLTETIQSITGKALPPDLLRQYKKQQLFELKILYGIESCDLEISQVSINQVNELIDTLIPYETCKACKVVPLAKLDCEPPSILVAMVSPDDLNARDLVEKELRRHNYKLQRMVIALEDHQQLINQYLDFKAKKDTAAEFAKSFDVKQDLEGIENLDLQEVNDNADADLNLEANQDAPIISLVNRILGKALKEGVSDIHVEPQEEFLKVRFRKDGVLQQAFDPLPRKIAQAVSARFKIIAELDIAERRLPQDGRIRRIFEGRKVDFRVSTLPSRYGEKIVLRILDNSSTQLGLDKLITDQVTLEIARDMASRPFGLILVTGPTGSGKSTTLYSMLAERNDPKVNICTAEDPIEYGLPGITQVQVIREKNMDFAAILRSFLRQDPDVILVGETRDKETAKTAMEAALTGHLVLTTLHTNDAAGAIARLDEMGVEPFMISGALIGVLAQRLMRRVCSECRIAYTPTKAELSQFGLSMSTEGEITFYKANTLLPEQIQEGRSHNTLCEKCNGIGYKGRVGVYELMQMTENLQNLINQRASTALLKEAAVSEGMTTLLAYSLDLVRQGYTTLEEVERVTFTDSGLEAEMKAKRKSSLTCKTCMSDLQTEWLDCPYCLTPRFAEETLS